MVVLFVTVRPLREYTRVFRAIAPVYPSEMEGLHPRTTRKIGGFPMAEPLDPAHPVARRLRPGERIQAYIPVAATEIVVTDQRLAVSDEERLALDIEIAALRRIQFDIERDRPATLVIVPDHALDEPQVLAIPPDKLPAVAEALAYIGQRLYLEGLRG